MFTPLGLVSGNTTANPTLPASCAKWAFVLAFSSVQVKPKNKKNKNECEFIPRSREGDSMPRKCQALAKQADLIPGQEFSPSSALIGHYEYYEYEISV